MPTAGTALHIQEDVLMYRLLNKYLMFALLLGGAFSVHAAHAAPPQDLKGTNVVLVHGAFADGSSWDRVPTIA